MAEAGTGESREDAGQRLPPPTTTGGLYYSGYAALLTSLAYYIPRFLTIEEEDDTESLEQEEKEELKSYSRRKIVSNWSRYEDTEKEGQSEGGETQRGTDFSVLLSSAELCDPIRVSDATAKLTSGNKIHDHMDVLYWTFLEYTGTLLGEKEAQKNDIGVIKCRRPVSGDSFAQFRFADEKEWDRENICHKQLSALSVDCQSLVQALQELPLHLRLNVAAELVQASTPAELPQMKTKIIEDSRRKELLFRQSQVQGERVLVSNPIGVSVAPSEPISKNGPRAGAAEPFRGARPPSKQETDHLEEELDLILNLDGPIDTGNRPVSGALTYDLPNEKDLKTGCKENDTLKLDVPAEKSTASQQQQSTCKNVTEEELEDWLDSMIS